MDIFEGQWQQNGWQNDKLHLWSITEPEVQHGLVDRLMEWRPKGSPLADRHLHLCPWARHLTQNCFSKHSVLEMTVYANWPIGFLYRQTERERKREGSILQMAFSINAGVPWLFLVAQIQCLLLLENYCKF